MAHQATNAPKSPNLKQLEKAIATIDEAINDGLSFATVDEHNQIVHLFDEPTIVAWRDALEWTHVFLENRRDYHKRRNAQAKIEIEQLTQALRAKGVNVDEIKRRAASAADDTLLDE